MEDAARPRAETHNSVCVVIVNYATADLAVTAVASVLEHGDPDLLHRIIVLDNGSPQNDATRLSDMLARLSPSDKIQLIAQPDNLGFGKGNNAVFAQLEADPPDYVLLLNPDAAFKNDVLTELGRTLQDHPQVGCVGAGIDGPNGTPVTSAFRFPTLANAFVDTIAFGPLSRRLKTASIVLPPDHPAGQVDWVAGAAVMLRWRALQDCGYFDPDFFLYEEEVELIWRMRQRGWLCWFTPSARVSHLEGVATQVNSHEAQRGPRPAYWYESQRLFLQKTRTRFGALLFALVKLKAALLHRASRQLTRKPSDLPAGFVPDYWSHVLRPLLFSQKGNRA